MTILTTPFSDAARAMVQGQGVSELSLAVVEHPIAGHNLEGIRRKMDGDFSLILKAATHWQPK